MGEHSSLQDRLGWIVTQVGEGSPHQLAEAQAFVDSLSESGYTEWLGVVYQVQSMGLFGASEPTDYDHQLWLSLPQRVRDILSLVASVVGGNKLSRVQTSLLAELQAEQDIESFPELQDLPERRLLAELETAKAWDQCKPIVPRAERDEIAKERPPEYLRGTGYERDRRRWG